MLQRAWQSVLRREQQTVVVTRFALGLVAVLAAGAALFTAAVSAAPVNNILVTEPRVRAMPPGSMNTAAYLTLKNQGKTDVVLDKVVSPVAEKIMLHDTVSRGGRMAMEHRRAITIPAGKRVKLKPGGLHIMLIGLHRQLVAGAVVDLELHFTNGTVIPVKATVKKQVAEGGNLSG